MSEKPEDIPQDVWDEAQRTFVGFEDPIVLLSRAIMAAEQRGAEKEREACALVAGAMTQLRADAINRDYIAGIKAGARRIATAIRARSNPHDPHSHR